MKQLQNDSQSGSPVFSLSYEEVRRQIQAMLPIPDEFADEQNLIELGLDSLQMMRLVNKWRRAGSTVTFAELIAAPRLRDWWSFLQRGSETLVPDQGAIDADWQQTEESAPFPLTDVQYAYWIGRRDDQPLGGVGCHAYLEIDGAGVEHSHLEAAWAQLLAHHPMLRVRFLADGLQEVLAAPFSTAVPVHDLRLLSEEQCASELTRIREQLSHRRLAVEAGEVAGLALSLLPEGRTRIHFDIDLLVADVQSLHILLRDLAAAYARGCPPPAPAAWSFAHYLKREAHERAADKKRAAAYWRERLPELPGAPGLPLQVKPEAISAPRFRRRTHVVTADDWAVLQKRAAANRVTPAMVLLTAYAEVLERWSAHSHFLINIPLFDRQTGVAGIEEAVADFTNLLLLEVDFRSRQSFLERVRKVQAQFHQDVAHASYSGVQLQRDLARIRQGERDFAPVVFACNLGTPLITEECRDTLGTLSYMISQTPQVWLDFQTYEMDGGLLLAWDAVEQLFPSGMIDQMFAAFAGLMNWLTAVDNDWHASADLISGLEQQRNSDAAAKAEPQASQCLHASFFANALAHPQQTALIDSHCATSYSYGELSRSALQVAGFLKEQGMGEGEPVAITLPRGNAQIAAVLGIMAAGGCYVPISIEQPAARRERIHKKAGIRYVLTDGKRASSLDWPGDAVVLAIEDAAKARPLAAPVSLSAEALAYIIFTSGSTGEPKGVEVSHAGAWNTIAGINRRYEIGPADRVLAVSSLDFDLSVFDIFGLLGAGGSLVLITEETRRDAAHWLYLLDTHQVTLWNSVPMLLDMLLVAAESRQHKSLPLRVAMLSGDWIGLDLPDRLQRTAAHCQLVAMGGATEASIWSNFFDVTLPLPAHWASIPYGRPLPNQAYRVVDGQGRDCPDWVAGELWIGGAGVAQGYRGDPALTAERFVWWKNARWYRTGDMGRYWRDGTIEFLGRQDFQVKIKGHRIELGEIEAALKQHPGIRDAVVTAVGEGRDKKHLIGYVVPEAESSLLDRESVDSEIAEARWQVALDAGHDAQSGQGGAVPLEREALQQFWRFVDRLSVRYMCRALEKAGAVLPSGEGCTLEAMMERCGIGQRYRELLKQWLAVLEDEGFVKKSEADIYFMARAPWDESLFTVSEGELHPSWSDFARALYRCVEQLDCASTALLTGATDPLTFFFADGQGLSPSELMKSLPGTDCRNSIVRAIVAAIGQQPVRTEPLRVLEVGARNGQLTASILPLLRADATAYTCTDQSTFFLHSAKDACQAYSFVDYQLLDMEQHPQAQGYEAYRYDVIITADSLHRARNVGTALTHLQSLLAPGGLLIVSEMTRNSHLQLISTGFLEDGFTRFEDERKTVQRPLLSVETWQQLLQAHNFRQVAIYPALCGSDEVIGQHVLIAQGPSHVRRFNPGTLSGHLSKSLPDYMVPTVFLPLAALPLTANGKVDRQSLPAPDRLLKEKATKAFVAPATPAEIELAEIWCQLFERDQVGIADNYFELGGDSLLATRLSALVKSRLGVELPLGRIFEKPTIAQLAECVQMLAEQQAREVETASGLPAIVPAPKERHLPFPLTDIQQAYWLGRSGAYSLGNVSTHCYFEIEGMELDLVRIKRVWQRLIDHHDMMRAVLLPDGVQQQILERVPPYEITVMDMRGQGIEAVESGLAQTREEMSHQVLATDVWPLFDVRASLYGEGRVRLHISFDNLLFDGWSMFHLLSEWTRLYHEPDAPLSVTDLSFRDYVLAAERLKQSDLYQRDLEYWLTRLPDLPTAPELVLAQDPDSLTEQRFARLEAKLDRQTWQQLKRRTAEAGLTPSGILLAAYAETLGLWSKSPRFTINLTQFNRLPLHADVQKLVGDFTTLTLLAVDQTAGKTFLERGRNVQQQLWRDLEHPLVGGVQVQRELAKLHGEHHGVSMPVVFTSALGVDQWGGAETDGKWLGKLVYNITQTPQVWLDHQVVEQDGELLLIWDAVEGLFPAGMLADMFAAYCGLLQRLTGDEAAWREAAPSLLTAPRLAARAEANDTTAPVSPETLDSLVSKQSAVRASHPAIVTADRTLTYGELTALANQVSAMLREKGAKPDTLVAVVMEKGWEQVVAVLGIVKSGAAYLPIDISHPEERRWQLLRDGGVSIVLTQSWLDKRLNWPADIERVTVDQLTACDEPILTQPYSGRVEDLAYVIYTSGSTGLPKGVMIDHRGAVNTILDVNERFSVGPDDRILALSNLNFDLSVYDLFGMLAAGGTIIMPEAYKAKDPAHWIEWLEREQVTVWNTVPALMQMLLEYASGRNLTLPQSLRLVLLSGDWIPLDLPDKIKACFSAAEVIGLGGATEASIWSNLYPIREVDPEWKSIPYGRPMVNQRYHVLNGWMGDCPVWVPGQLYIGGIGLAQGYWRDEEKTRDKFVHHPRTGERLYRTGDLGRYLPDGTLEFLGREDFQVKIRGHRIELGEIETALKRHDGIKDAVVAVIDNQQDEKRLVGYVVVEREAQTELFETVSVDRDECTTRWRAIAATASLQAAQLPDAPDLEAARLFLVDADQVSTAAICRTLAQLGMYTCVGERSSLDDLMRNHRIVPRYRTLLLHWLNVLEKDGLLEKDAEGGYRSLRALPEGFHEDGAACQHGETATVGNAGAAVTAKTSAELAALFARDSHLFASLLTGKVDPLELYLADDAFLTPAALRVFDLSRDYYSDLAAKALDAIITSYPPDKKVSVLEIGTRAGASTGRLASLLPADRGLYVYADESPFFIDKAKATWGERAELAYGLFDMNSAPLGQGFEPHSFDVIVADNTLHRARNLDKTLAYVKELLAPGGHLLLIEGTRNNRLLLTTVAFFEDGFSHFEDERKERQLPLLTAETWTALLQKQGFAGVVAFPQSDQAAEAFARQMFVAQAPATARLFRPEKLTEAMRQKLPDYMVPTTYTLLEALPLSANGKVDRKALTRLGGEHASAQKKARIAPVTKTQVTIAAIWGEVLGGSEIGIDDNFFALGGDSLRAIQCINLIKERCRIEVSLHNLFEASTIRQLAQFIEERGAAVEPMEIHFDEGLI